MSFAQQRLWILDQLAGGSALYNMACPQRFAFAVDADALRRALNEIVRRHEALRTTFAIEGGAPSQVIAPQLELGLLIEDLRALAPDSRDEEVARLTATDAMGPFDLTIGPLIRAKLLRLADDDYVFLLTMHHIVCDGWSMGVFFRELSALYQAFLLAQPAPLAELRVQYADFSVWQRAWLQGEVRDSQLGYWREQLKDLATLELPADRSRPRLQSFRGASHPLQIGADTLAHLRLLCRQYDVTLFMALLATFQVLLHRYTGQDDIVVGSPVANRNRAETEGLIGFFVNSLVMRTSVSGDPTFAELLDRTKRTAVEAYANQDLPFEMLVDELRSQRDVSRNPLFQVVFQLLETAAVGGPASLQQLSGTPALQMGTAKFDLNLTLFVMADGITGSIECATDLFDADRIARMVGHFKNVVEDVVRAPAQRISRLALVGAAERRQLLVDWNATAVQFPRGDGVLAAFERNATERPGAPAVHFAERTFSYGELDRAANRLAWQLRRQGIVAGMTVAVCVPRSPEMIIGALAAMKAAAAYLPLDADNPHDRLALMLRESGAQALVTTLESREHFAGAPVAAIVCIDSDDPAIDADAAPCPRPAYDEDAVAYVIFTSGSTGAPKGVEIQHRGLTNLVAWHRRAFDVHPVDRASQFAGAGFDAVVWEVWPYLVAGASIDIVDEAARYAPASLAAWLCARGVTHCFVPTPVVDAVLRSAWPRECRLRFMLTGGDKLHRGVPAGLPFAVFNQYGPTENSVVTTSARVGEDAGDGKPPPIGRPIDNVELFVVDRNGEPMPQGIPGELLIGGAGLSRGYVNSPALTQERFVAQPGDARKRVYRSGDLVRYRPDGELEFLGRVDEQIKIRGFRVEPGEIESELAQDPAVRSACVVAREDATGHLALEAYIVAAATPAPTASALRERLHARLPAYMVPAHIVLLDAFPLTRNGKIDHARLAQPGPPADRANEAVNAPPDSELEAWVARIWQQELNLASVGVDDNFFDVGGNSLLLVQVHRRLEERFRNRISVVDLFSYPTIRALVAFLEFRDDGDCETLVDRSRQRAEMRRQAQSHRQGRAA